MEPGIESKPESKLAQGEHRVRVGCLSPTLGLLSIGGAFCLANLSYGAYVDGMSRPADRQWGALGMLATAGPLIAGFSGIGFLRNRSRWVLTVASVAAMVGIVGGLALSAMGLRVVASAERSGGDWAGLAVTAAWMLSVIFPALLAAICFILRKRLRHFARSSGKLWGDSKSLRVDEQNHL